MDSKEYLNNSKLKEYKTRIASGDSLVIEKLWDAPKALLLTLALELTQKHIVILSGGLRESRLFDDFAYFFGRTPLEFPAWETLPSEEVPPSPDIVGDRYRILREIQEKKTPQIILTSLQAILQKVLLPEKLEKLHLILKKGSTCPFDELPHVLSEMGYHKRGVAADKGEFAVRGGILDIFPVSSPDPFRIEFWEDEIVSIRKYDPVGQTSVGTVQEIVITPGEEQELLAEQTELATVFDYLGPETIVVFDDLEELEDKYIALKSLGTSSKMFMDSETLFKVLAQHQKLYFVEESLDQISQVKMIERPNKISFESFNQELTAYLWRHPFFPVLASFCPPEHAIEEFSANDFFAAAHRFPQITFQFICQNLAEKNKVAEALPQATIEEGYLSTGFFMEEPPFALIPMTELTHRYKIRRQKQRSHYHTLPVEMMTLTPGEAVVHLNSGIGRYLGIEKRANHLGVETEFMLLQYAEGSKLYVPMEQANLVSKYIGATDTPPEYHKLGSSKWQRSKEKTEQAIQGYAEELLKVQAERVIKGGFVYPENSELINQFRDEFPYEETPDQQLAIESIHKDMLSNKSMDRLVCGDVGFGKTEVAMRAAFKAVVDGGKQVAVLVPTTVLAMQHFETFAERMANFPVKVAMLSRFVKPQEAKKNLEDLENGKIDILVGTHRLINKDVKFKNLGLVIIDEEQRFGVKAKEHLKALQKDVDCLTLSATPIPRTLYLSLVGARDLSVISTPPQDRLPIQSVVCHTSDELIKQALLRELARDGQAYVVHNRVETIYQLADRIRNMIPEARIVVGHGQMSAQEIDTVFHAFKTHKADILVATSIIENGIDIPNANTILIDRADRFGMADLYQMRGRVGRWNKKAYCYFLVPSTHELSEMSRKRLSALTSASGGMKIAMHDLEIRGAGNILGTDQSGHVATIGFFLYCKLLKKTVNALQKNEIPFLSHELKIEFPYDARIPDTYINETNLRMDIYQRLGDADTEEEVDLIIEELADRFGPIPPEVRWLHRSTRIRVFATRNHFTLLKLTKAVFHADQMHGKQEKLTKKMILSLPRTPEELEEKILKALKENFPLIR